MENLNKMELFASELIGDKSVDDIYGIGPYNAKRFKDELNITKAYQLLVAFLYFEKDKERFRVWFEDIVGGEIDKINCNYRRCYNCLVKWYDNHASQLGTIPSFKPPVNVTIDNDKLIETLINYIEKFKDSPEYFLCQVPVPSINQSCYDWIAEWVVFVQRV